MEFQDVVRRRRMVRSFDSRPIPPEVLGRILENARRAPSAGNSQGWAFLVLEGAEDTGRFWDAINPERQGAWPELFNAPVVVVCLSDKETYLRRYAEPDKGWADMDERRWAVPYWDIDTAMAAMLILLSAVDAGLGALFFGLGDRHGALHERFGIPGEMRAIGAIALGYAKPRDRRSGSLRRGPRPAGEVVHVGRW